MPIQWKAHPDVLSVNSIRQIHIDLSHELASTELLSGTPTVTEVGTSHMTITEIAILAADETIDGEKFLSDKTVTFMVSCAIAGVYTLVVSVQTSSRPTQQVLVYEATMSVL